MQDDTYTESYISTIGVDFVRTSFLSFFDCCVYMLHCIDEIIYYENDCRKFVRWSWIPRSSSCKLCVISLNNIILI